MTDPETYAHTYWSHKGKYPEAQAALAKLVPSQGQIPDTDTKNAFLEVFRVASNCYYDLYNNGLCNRAVEFRKVFGSCGYEMGDELSVEVINDVEDRMDEIVEQAANEQNIPLDKTPEERYKAALEYIASMWPDPGKCAELVPAWVGPNDGRMRADTLWFALNKARQALGKPEYPRPEHWDKKDKPSI